MKILVVGPSWIGDMIMSQSFFCTLKKYYPQSKIDVIAPAWCYPLLSCMPEINEAILIRINHGSIKIGERYRFGFNLRIKHYDRAYILPNSFKSALIPFFAKIPYRIGWRGEMRYGLLNEVRILNKKAWPMMVDRYVALAYEQGVVCNAKNLPSPILWPKLQILEDEKLQECNRFNLRLERPIIGFCPGSEFGPAKCWPYYHYAELAKKLIKEGYQIALFGSIKDYETNKNIFILLNSEQQVWCHNLIGKTKLKQAVILISVCKAIITNDSGLMHVASALNRPLVALYGPSDPNFTPPLSSKARIIRLITGYYKIRKNNYEKEGYHQSLINISPQKVLEELHDLLSKEKVENASTNC